MGQKLLVEILFHFSGCYCRDGGMVWVADGIMRMIMMLEAFYMECYWRKAISMMVKETKRKLSNMKKEAVKQCVPE